ncbi:response regulator [Paenibacillus typhae]|uniref:Two-component response regulator, YesN/AraC family, consists of REC and AraC-type DNA-binding domains n=1 Tax=Paenibacillus typhae TaxID=1174501 RepID=A0A1G8GSQ9_9BACL|nr:response regulator [Paenibacillus typhae]SDH97301.1 Two-component response regulator, YesN/AraC family, consists of REC and AraC-type DNA-binding domains [Paenibacillus typhae]
MMRSILLVDDDPHILKALTRHVGWDNLELTIAGSAVNGTEALELFRELSPDLVMTDVYMPGMSGLELTETLREQNPELPIIILSGYEEFENARQAMRWGVSHFLLKPARVEEIEGVLREVLLELDVQEQKRRLEERYKLEIGRTLPYLRERLLMELLTTRYSAEELPEERLGYLQIAIPQQLAAASIQLNRPPRAKKLKEREWQLLRFGAGNICRETIHSRLAGYPSIQGHVLDYSEDMLVILLLDSEAEELSALLTEAVQEAADKIMNYIQLQAYAGIGAVKQAMHELIDSYLESREALLSAEYQGTGLVYTYEQYGGKNQWTLEDYSRLLQQWNEALLGKDPGAIWEIWEVIHTRLQEDEQNAIQDIQTVCVGLFTALMYFWNACCPVRTPPMTMPQFLQTVSDFPTWKSLTEWMGQIFPAYLKAAFSEMGVKRNRLVDSVRRYVEANYNQEISFMGIAQELHVHPKYLSQLFKRITGENFVSYLNHYRIERAIEYLQSGQHMVYEISEMVGFNNPAYFSQVFKMITGRSPSEYLNA